MLGMGDICPTYMQATEKMDECCAQWRVGHGSEKTCMVGDGRTCTFRAPDRNLIRQSIPSKVSRIWKLQVVNSLQRHSMTSGMRYSTLQVFLVALVMLSDSTIQYIIMASSKRQGLSEVEISHGPSWKMYNFTDCDCEKMRRGSAKRASIQNLETKQMSQERLFLPLQI